MAQGRSLTHDATARFRINGQLMQRAADTAVREGMSLSELFRQALRAQVQG